GSLVEQGLGNAVFRRVLRDVCSGEVDFPELAAEVEGWDTSPPAWVATALQRRRRARDQKLAPFAWAFERLAATEQAKRHPHAAEMLREYVEDHVVRTGRLPSATHDFGDFQTGPRSGVSVGMVNFGTLFRERPKARASAHSNVRKEAGKCR